MKKHKVNQSSQEWHLLRENKVTASNAYILLKKGVKAATNGVYKEHNSGFWGNRGLILEKEAIEIYEQVKNKKVELVGFVTNSKYPNCGYSPDGWGVEVKCFQKEKHLKCMEELPIEVYCQVQFGMMITDQKKIDVILYNPDIEDSSLCFKAVEVKRDNTLIKRFKEKLKGKNNKTSRR